MMFAATCLAWAVLAALGFGGEAVHYEGRTIGEIGESLRKQATEQCIRRSGLTFDFIDPLHLGTFTVTTGEFVVKNKNTVMTGLSQAAISDVNWFLEENRGSIKVSANVTMTSDYNTAGKFLYLPMSSSGKLTVHGYDFKADVTFNFRKVLINSIEYLEIYNLKSDPTFGLLQFNLKSDGSCSIADSLVNAALNANWRLLEPVGVAEVTEIVAQKMEAEMNAFFKKVPFYELTNFVQ